VAGPAEREKRKTPRIQPFVAPCKVIDGERKFSGYLIDLSTRGARVSSNAPLASGSQEVVIEVRFNRRAPFSRLPARVQWMKPGSKPGEAAVFGVTFEGIGAAGEALLESVVREFQRHAALLA
jgi:hypothetical protein